MKAFTVVAPLLLALTATMAQAQDATPAPADAKVYFISPKDGARIRGPVNTGTAWRVVVRCIVQNKGDSTWTSGQ